MNENENISINSQSKWHEEQHKNLSGVPLLNSMWATVHNQESAIFVKLSQDLKTERTVIFTKRTPD
jgi:hypothetical protein